MLQTIIKLLKFFLRGINLLNIEIEMDQKSIFTYINIINTKRKAEKKQKEALHPIPLFLLSLSILFSFLIFSLLLYQLKLMSMAIPVLKLLLLFLPLLINIFSFVQGQTWCVTRSDASSQALQNALDYACASGADCTPIQSNGLCFLPNTIQAHASYAYNSYYQRRAKAPGSCDFSGTATVAKTDPSFVL